MKPTLSRWLKRLQLGLRADQPLDLSPEFLFPRLDNIISPPPPPDILSIQVLGDAASATNFLYGGYVVAEGLKNSLEVIGRPLHLFRRVLDFGCGSSRVLRWFRDYAPFCEFHGSDFSRQAIEWNQAKMPFGKFAVNQEQPPLPYPDNYFDCIYVVSVVTHLDEPTQNAWLSELKRVLMPGGIVLMSIVGSEVAASRLEGEDFTAYSANGHFYKRVQAELHGLPDFYQDAFHSQAYVERVWSKLFLIRAYIRNGPLFLQDLVLLEKPVGSIHAMKPGEAEDSLKIDLPLSGLGHPTLGSIIRGAELTIDGWAFQLDGTVCELDVTIDERRVGTCAPDLPSSHVMTVLGHWPVAANAGFAVTVPLAGVAPGAHRLALLDKRTGLKCLSTYFFRD